MPAIQVEGLADFSGGLNLEPDAFKLGENESPDMSNVDVLPRGGFQLRRGSEIFGAVLPAELKALIPYQSLTGIHQLVIQHGTTVQHGIGGTWTNVATARTGTIRAATFKDRLYIIDGLSTGTAVSNRWNGTLSFDFATGIGPGNFNDDLENPTVPPADGKFPRARTICSWGGSMFVGGVYEGTTLYPNRVRWSHPNFPEDWHSQHYIDVDTTGDQDAITALVPAGERLLVFKRSSVHVIAGSVPEGIYTTPLTYESGAVSQEAVVATDIGVFYFDPAEGVYLIDSSGQPKWQFAALYPAIKDGRIEPTQVDKTTLGWGRRRLWVALPFDGSTTRNVVFVLDPFFRNNKTVGAWVRYDMRAGPFAEWEVPNTDYRFLGGGGPGDRVMRYEVEGQPFDRIATGPDVINHIPSHLRTAWVDLGHSSMEKSWKRPEIVLKAAEEANATISVNVYYDYKASHAGKNFNLTTTAQGGVLVWGTGLPENQWGNNVWAGSGDRLNEVLKGALLGRARAVALDFIGPLTNVDWGVNQAVFKYIPRKIKS